MKKVNKWWKNDKLILLIVTVLVYGTYYSITAFKTGGVFGKTQAQADAEKLQEGIAWQDEQDIKRVKLKANHLTFGTGIGKDQRVQLLKTKQCLTEAKRYDAVAKKCTEFKSHDELMTFSSKENLQKIGFSTKNYKSLLGTTTFSFAKSVENIK